MDVLVKNFDERKETLEADLASKKETLQKATENIEKLTKESDENNKKSKKASDDMEVLKKEYFEVVAKLDKAKEAQNEFVSQLNEKQSRKNILEDLEKGIFFPAEIHELHQRKNMLETHIQYRRVRVNRLRMRGAR